MLKKTIAAIAAIACAVGVAAAQDASSAPKIGFALSQRVDGEFVNGAPAASATFGSDALYSRTEFSGSAAYKFGALTLAPSLTDRLELRLNPGTLPGAVAASQLGSIRGRDRLYASVTASLALSPALTLGFGVENRLATDLSTAKGGTALPEERVNPNVTLSGTVGSFYYSLLQNVPLYLDLSTGSFDNATDDFYVEMDGTYNAGFNFAVGGGAALKLDLTDALVVDMPKSARAAAGDKAATTNGLALKLSLGKDGVVPGLGGFLNTATNAAGTTTASVVGGSALLGLSAGSWSLNGQADMGVNTASGMNNRLESRFTVSAKIKG